MTDPTATLISAVIAAGAGIVVIILQVIGDWGSESRGAHRLIIQPYLEKLGEAIFSIVATCDIMLKTKTDESHASWKAKAHGAQVSLKDIRAKIRYPLWGLDEGIRALTRLPNWTALFRRRPVEAKALLKRADQLRWAIDLAVRHSYTYGRPPIFYESYLVSYRTKQIRKLFESASKNRKR